MNGTTSTKAPELHLMTLTRMSDGKQWYIGYTAEQERWSFIQEWVNERSRYRYEDKSNLDKIVIKRDGEEYTITSHKMTSKLEFFLPVEGSGGLR